MKRILSLAILAAGSLAAANAPLRSSGTGDPDNLIVHEWGTFTSIAGEDGRAADWLPLDGQSDLPCFVERFPFPGKYMLSGTVRMETPVLYFYAPRVTTVDVGVRFPQGLITEWFPRATVTPATVPTHGLGTRGFAGTARWKAVTVTPGAAEAFPTERPGSHYYAARLTDAAPLRVGAQQEKFLFYRGVGRFDLPLTATVAEGQVRVRASAPEGRLGTVILFENRGGKLGHEVRVASGSETVFSRPTLTGDLELVTSGLEKILVAEGLYVKEARAMIETWRDSWFEEGTRLFYIVPSQTIAAVLPLDITPRPMQLVRVFVGRLELMTPTTLDEIRQAVESNDTPALLKHGRFLSPAIDRLYGQNASPAERTRINRALTPFYQRRPSVPACPAVPERGQSPFPEVTPKGDCPLSRRSRHLAAAEQCTGPADGAARQHPGENPRRADRRKRGGPDLDPAGANGRTDGIGIGWRIDQGVGRAKLLEQMQIGIANQRLSVRSRPGLRPAVEIQPLREHRVDLDGVDDILAIVRIPPHRGTGRIEGVRGDDQPVSTPLFQPPDIVEARHAARTPRENSGAACAAVGWCARSRRSARRLCRAHIRDPPRDRNSDRAG